MPITTATLARRPDLADSMDALDDGWPEFMHHDPTSSLYYTRVTETRPDHVLVAFDTDAPDTALARAFTVPFHWDRPLEELPDGGWDWVIRRAALDPVAGRTPTAVSALEILIRPDRRGTGLSALMLEAMRDNAAAQGFTDLVAPVRPSAKHLVPDMTMQEYAHRTRADGLPEDPWLRVHARAGARILKVAPLSMVVPGTLPQWRAWTGLPFDETGPVHVPHALTPVHCDTTHDLAVYVEPNVWMHHPLG